MHRKKKDAGTKSSKLEDSRERKKKKRPTRKGQDSSESVSFCDLFLLKGAFEEPSFAEDDSFVSSNEDECAGCSKDSNKTKRKYKMHRLRKLSIQKLHEP